MTRWLLIGLWLLCLASVAPAASIQARLVRAANEQKPADPGLADIAGPLQKVFGYEDYRLLGREKHALVENKWVKLNLGEGFSVLARPRGIHDNQQQIDVEVYSGKAALAKATIGLAPGKPVLIKGPQVGSTLMIIALSLRD